MKQIIKEILQLIKYKWKIRNQRTFCYCPVCNNELCSTNSLIKDTNLVYYKCSKCGSDSIWNFDIAPAPILRKYKPISNKYINYKY